MVFIRISKMMLFYFTNTNLIIVVTRWGIEFWDTEDGQRHPPRALHGIND